MAQNFVLYLERYFYMNMQSHRLELASTQSDQLLYLYLIRSLSVNGLYFLKDGFMSMRQTCYLETVPNCNPYLTMYAFNQSLYDLILLLS